MNNRYMSIQVDTCNRVSFYWSSNTIKKIRRKEGQARVQGGGGGGGWGGRGGGGGGGGDSFLLTYINPIHSTLIATDYII